MRTLYFNPKPAIIVLLTIIQLSSRATVYPINVNFSGSQEAPANNSTATGTFVGTYNDVTDSLIYTITFSGLSTNVTAAHFHGYVPPGIAGPVIFAPTNPLFPTGVMSGTFVDSVKLTQGQEDSLKMGLIYFNIHTTNFPGGEIRAQLFLQDASFVVPDISCPPDINANTDPGVCTANVTFAATTTVAGTPASVIYYRIGNTAITSPRVFPLGTTTVVATALNAAGYDSCSFKVIVRDVERPVITCPANITLPNAPGQCGAIATFSATATDNCGSPTVTVQPASGTFFQVGTTTVTATATDANGNTATCSFTVTVNDVESPVINSLLVRPPVLWPPNHKMKNVDVDYTSTDNCPGPITCSITVTSDEPENGTGDGDLAPDWDILNDHHIKLRAERAGNGDGRIYSVKVTCTDAHGNTASGTRIVLVPKNMSSKDIRLLVFQNWSQGNGHGQGHKVVEESASGKNIITLNEQDPENSTFVRVYPNPSASAFTVNIESFNNKEDVSLRIIDIAGRIVEVRSNLAGSQTLKIGSNLKAGLYIAEIRQGNESKTIKLLKQ
jgi:hypothetical protein